MFAFNVEAFLFLHNFRTVINGNQQYLYPWYSARYACIIFYFLRKAGGLRPPPSWAFGPTSFFLIILFFYPKRWTLYFYIFVFLYFGVFWCIWCIWCILVYLVYFGVLGVLGVFWCIWVYLAYLVYFFIFGVFWCIWCRYLVYLGYLVHFLCPLNFHF